MNKNVSGPGTIVGANVKLTGTLKDSNEIVVHGRVEGEVISDKMVTVAENALVKGPVTAQIISVAGTIRGSVTAADKMEILPTGKIYGSIAAKDISIRSGAIFVGKCTMPDKEEVAGEEEEKEGETKETAEKKEEEAFEVE